MRCNLVGHLTCAIAVSALALALALAAAPAGEGGPQLIANPAEGFGDLFGISVAAVGSDKVIIGASAANAKGGNEGMAFLFDLNGTLLQTYYPELFESDESYGAHVTGVGDDRVLISATQDDEMKPSLAGAAYLYDLKGFLLESFSNPTPSIGDGFGWSAALGTETVVIGAPGDDTDGTDTGRAYVFAVGGEGGPQTIQNPSPTVGDRFGAPIAAIGTDRVAIGAFGAGEVYIFQLPSGNLVTTITPPFPATALAWVSATNQLLVGAEDATDGKVNTGAAYLFDIATGNLDLTISNPDPEFDDAFGIKVAVLGNGTLAIAADLDNPFKLDDAGTVYLFDTEGTQLDVLNSPTPQAGDQFGFGGLAVVGCNQLVVGTPQGEDSVKATGPGEAWVFSDLAGGNCVTSNNYVEIHLERIDDFELVETAFEAEIIVVIPDEQDVGSVDVLTGGELFVGLQDLGDGRWSATICFFDLDDLRLSLDGLWNIDIEGFKASTGSFSNTDFSFDALSLIESDFFATPTDVDPANDAIDVPIDANFSWTDPTGPKDTADVLFVISEPLDGSAGSQEDDSLEGSLSVSDTTWDPPQDLLPGANRFEVGYVNFDDGTTAGELEVQVGSIEWGNSPLAPKGYPEITPLVTLGSSTIVGFGAGAGSVGFDDPDVTPAAGVPVQEATGDFDGDGTTDVVVVIPDLDPSLPGSFQVFLNQGNDEFGEWLGFVALPAITVGLDPSWVTVGQFNFDAHPDVCVTNAGDDNVSIFLNDGTGNGTFLAAMNVAVGDGPSSCTTGQFNTLVDPFVDIAVTNANDEDIVFLFNDGNGNFTLGGGAASAVVPLGLRTAAMTTGDFDGNKCPDAVGAGEADAVGAGNGTVGLIFVLLDVGDGTFEPPILIEIGADPRDISVADINGDTLDDIIAVNRGDGTISIVLNLGSGMFADPITVPVGSMPRSVVAVDLDGDNDPDIAVVADDPEVGPSVQILVNRSGEPIGFGSGPVVLDPPLAFGVGGNPNFVVHTDLDGDGLSDLCTVNENAGEEGGSLSVLLNELIPEGAEDCPGDINGDGFVNISDFILLLAAWGPCDGDCPADLDGDGQVGILDLLELLHAFGPCVVDQCPWDVNDDGVVDFWDILDVLEHVGDCADPLNCPWDLDGDGFVSFADVLIVLANLGPCDPQGFGQSDVVF